MAEPKWHMVAYDVRDPKRLRKVAKLLEGYGSRIQYSIFRVHLTETKLQKLRWELEQKMESEDNLLVIPLCNRCAGKVNELSRGDESDWGDAPPSFDIM